ncbi:MAG: ATP synthase F1 subunit delta [Acidobacteria bacterium]|nr:ATP synthase F1 subunit delta [Acidobacteriota bacterium]
MASVVSVYARAFADVVLDRKLHPAATVRQLKTLADLLSESKELREVWQAPSIPAEQKRSLLDAVVAKEGMVAEVRNFVAVLIDHRRILFLGAIVKQLQQELDQRLGFADAAITSARELSDEEKSALEAQVARLTGKKVHATYAHDAELLGGAVVKVGSTIYDGSVKGKLEKIREQLSGN